VRILGLVFAGTATDRRHEMTRFCGEVLGLDRDDAAGADAAFFALPDGARFAVAGPRGAEGTSRTIGFLVADLDEAVAALRTAGADVDDEPGENERYRYVHFRAPDGELYELVETR
jgi:catechol 2,3-dioxygenase-like lactoylglutathione lyase family enzyme